MKHGVPPPPFFTNNLIEIIESINPNNPINITNHFSKLLDSKIFKSNKIKGIMIRDIYRQQEYCGQPPYKN